MLDALLKTIERYKPEQSRALFHYCKPSTLRKLFELGGELFCTNAACLNDDREIVEGRERFLDFLNNECSFSASVINMLRENILLNLGVGSTARSIYNSVCPWVFSMSEEEDSPYQWRHYTDMHSGGYCVAFNTELLPASH